MNAPYMSTLYRISFNAEMRSCTVVRFSMNDNSTELSQVVQKYQTLYHCIGALIRNIYFRLSGYQPVLRATHLLPPQLE